MILHVRIAATALLLAALATISSAQSFKQPSRPLNANNARISALTTPRGHYFLEFPTTSATVGGAKDGDKLLSSPQCADGSPYSFLFRRGTDAHVNKLLVEFEGASSVATSVAWSNGHKYLFQEDIGIDNAHVPLGSCTGIPYGFISLGAELLGFGSMSMGMDGNNDTDAVDVQDVDVPILLRAKDQQHPGSTEKVWWEEISGDYSSIHDWSYLLLPRCTPGDGEGETTTNMDNIQSVFDWVTDQFSTIGKLDALVMASGGVSHGCNSSSSSVDSLPALSLFAEKSLMEGLLSPSSKALVIVDGATAWNEQGTSSKVEDALLTDKVEVAWVSSSGDSTDNVMTSMEDLFLETMKQSFGDSFHVYKPLNKGDEEKALELQCPLYAFPDKYVDADFSNLIHDVVKGMPWSENELNIVTADYDSNDRLSFLSIFLILLGCYLVSWAVYLCIKRNSQQQQETGKTATPPPTPHDLWLRALTRYPTLFLFVSIFIPALLSCIAYYTRDGISVNMDFNSYLKIDTKEERMTNQYKTLLAYQEQSLKQEVDNCKSLQGGDYILGRDRGRELGEIIEEEDQDRRNLQGLPGDRRGKTVISFLYQNRRGGNVFTPEVLESIHDFETYLMDVLEIQDMQPSLDSVVPYFYPDGKDQVDDIDNVLQTLSTVKTIVAKFDKYFSKDNYGSNITLTNVVLNKHIDGFHGSTVRSVLESLHEELWAIDQKNKYPDIIISWNNEYLREVEAADALEHDFKWSLAALSVIGLMIFIKVRSVFLSLAGVLGLFLSFTSALYWQYHFDFDNMSALHVAGIFVMLGIGADDIFLMIDTFEHTLTDIEFSDQEIGCPEIIRNRIVSAYKTAGSMMLVSSCTTAICFFSNMFSAVVSIRDFGSYLGVVVILNYIHVMSILPSAIVVNELHVKPMLMKVFCSKQSRSSLDLAGADTVRGEENQAVHEDVEAGSDLAIFTGAEIEQPTSQIEGEDNATRETVSISSNTDDYNENAPIEDDYKFLHRTKNMTSLDRYFVERYAPNVYRRHKIVVSGFLLLSILLGVLGYLNFTLHDGTMVVFKEKYNLGRVQKLVDEYFPEDLVSTYQSSSDVLTDVSTKTEDLESNSVGEDLADKYQSLDDEFIKPPTLAFSAKDLDSIGVNQDSSQTNIPTKKPTSSPVTPNPTTSRPTSSSPTQRRVTTPPTSPPEITSISVPTPLAGWLQSNGWNGPTDNPTDSTPVLVESTSAPLPPTSTVIETAIENWQTSAPLSANNSTTEIKFPISSIFAEDQPAPISLLPTHKVTPSPTPPPEIESIYVPKPLIPSSKPSPRPVPQFVCPPGLPCLVTNDDGSATSYRKQQYYGVSLVWGMAPIRVHPNHFVIVDNDKVRKGKALDDTTNTDSVDPSDHLTQEWLLRIATLARNDDNLRLQSKQKLWIEMLMNYGLKNGFGFPIQKELFWGAIEMLKAENSEFRKVFSREMSTRSPGIAGEVLFTSISMLAEAPLENDYEGKVSLRDWTNFTSKVNEMLPTKFPPIHAQSNVFVGPQQTTAIVDSTVSSYFFSNGLVLLAILVFTGNLILTLMIMASLILILLCFSGLMFAVYQIEFGAVESLGVSIFVGLTANYLLHIAHAYHQSNIKEHDVKIQRAIYIVGSPIAWSALSTIGGSSFLFACRTWLLTELGILIITVIALSLLFSIGFLLALLAWVGPLPLGDQDDKQHSLHSGDIKLVLLSLVPLCKCNKKENKEDTDPFVGTSGDAD